MAAPLTIVMKLKAMIRFRLKMKLVSKNGSTVIIRMATIHLSVETFQVNTTTATWKNKDVLRLLIHTGMTVSGSLKIVRVIVAAQLTDVTTQMRSQFKMK